ncbi:hypothetical protein CEXT_8511 [Caerostris extrusa]|uniref:Uncharacterized protein n=1 Tax=Caerostris extrusa TaxID=172846 RepID=A0AAV4PUR0_CAEEX|nr:hypothetical protein CEXT_8511 [Caerostris extrusa]
MVAVPLGKIEFAKRVEATDVRADSSIMFLFSEELGPKSLNPPHATLLHILGTRITPQIEERKEKQSCA